jgi:hypothetical protein
MNRICILGWSCRENLSIPWSGRAWEARRLRIGTSDLEEAHRFATPVESFLGACHAP